MITCLLLYFVTEICSLFPGTYHVTAWFKECKAKIKKSIFINEI